MEQTIVQPNHKSYPKNRRSRELLPQTCSVCHSIYIILNVIIHIIVISVDYWHIKI